MKAPNPCVTCGTTKEHCLLYVYGQYPHGKNIFLCLSCATELDGKINALLQFMKKSLDRITITD